MTEDFWLFLLVFPEVSLENLCRLYAEFTSAFFLLIVPDGSPYCELFKRKVTADCLP